MKDELSKLEDVAMGLARARFGNIENLTLVQRSAVEMGLVYAKRHWLDKYYLTDPEVAVNCVELAQIRKHQMLLLLQKERDLERMAIDEGITYEEAAFKAVMRGVHKNVNKELERLNVLAGQRTNQLIVIADNLGLMPATIDDAVQQTVERVLRAKGYGQTSLALVEGAED